MRVRFAGACNAHAMNRRGRSAILTGLSFFALQQAFSAGGVLAQQRGRTLMYFAQAALCVMGTRTPRRYRGYCAGPG